jgi:hypothetical protein
MAGEETTNQGNVRLNFNAAQTGLNMDQTLAQIPKGKLTYALNASVENFDSDSVNYQNEPGNELCLSFPEDYVLIGEHFIQEKSKHIFFLTNPLGGESEIGYMDNNDCVYRTLVNAPCLNFNDKYPIHKVVHKITNCTTEIYWTDGYNPRRYLDIDNIPYMVTVGNSVCDVVTSDQLDCNQLKIQPNFSIPSLEVTDVITGGNLTAGTYQFAIQYANATGVPYSSYYSVTNPTPIANVNTTTLDFNYPVGRSIVVNINDIDTTGYFEYFNLAVIKTVNNITSVELIGTYFIGNTNDQITYTGQNVEAIKLTVADIFEKFPYYEIAQDLTTVQDILVWDGLTSIDRVNYQKIANQIQLQWQTYRIPATENYADELNATNLRGYLRDEVYAFEIVFLLKNGKQTDGFHIPGRKLTYAESVQPPVPNTNPDFIGDGASAPYWKIYNTGSVSGTSPEYTSATDKVGYKGPYQYGQFAYWESADKYPCNPEVWGDLADQYIRHHKFPDVLVSPIFESGTPTIVANKYEVTMRSGDAVFPIGVNINSDEVYRLIELSDLTEEQKDDIVAYKIVRGNRSTNKSIVAKGILRNVGKYKREGTEYYYPNYPYNDLNKDPFLLEANNAYNATSKLYKLTVTTAGFVTITDINTGEITNVAVAVGAREVCSLTTPVPTTGTVISAIEGPASGSGTVLFTSNSTTVFTYQNPYNIFAQLEVTVTKDNPKYVYVWFGITPQYKSGDKNYTITEIPNRNQLCYPSELNGFGTDESKYRYVFNSPETSFGQPYLGDVLKVENAIYGAGKAHFVKVKNNAQYKFLTGDIQYTALQSSYNISNIAGLFNPTAMFTAYQAYLTIFLNSISRKNLSYSFNSIATYDYSAPVGNDLGIKQRQLHLAQYLIPGVQSVGDSFNVNNFQRESSVYLKTISTRGNASVTPLPFVKDTPSLQNSTTGQPYITDITRFTVSQKTNGCGNPENQESTTVVSYYASIKNTFINQWGQIYSYQTIDTGFQKNILGGNALGVDTFFGGDTFICKFAFKTKLPFFIDNRVDAPDDSDIFYDEIGNIAYPQYWHSSRSVQSNYTTPNGVTLQNVISVKATNLDCNNTNVDFTYGPTTSTTTTLRPGSVVPSSSNAVYTGKMYQFAYGIPSFYCESSINIDLRQAFNNREGDFYPHVSSGIPDQWLQQTFVPIAQDNTYYYNVSYSKQNTENFFSHLPVDWTPEICNTYYPFRAIYSDQQDPQANTRVNSWLSYSATSFFDFPQNYGGLTALDGIQNKAVLARFENKSLLYNTMLTINTSNPQAAYLGNSTLFKSAPPIDFAETDLGYVGSQNKMLLKIPQGQITLDAKRGQVFLIAGNQATDLSAFGSGVNKFFTDHLAFEILRYFPKADTDNHYTACGLHGVFDSKYDRVIISKLDYIPQTNQIGKIFYDEVEREYYVNNTYGTTVLREVVQLTDIRYFCNKSWTLSFSMNTKSWISFHSYIPNFYIAENNFFYSGLNEGCDLLAIAISQIPTPTTTTTTTIGINCSLAGEAIEVPGFTTTTSTSSSTTTSTTTGAPTTTTTTTPAPGSFNIVGFQNFGMNVNTMYRSYLYNQDTVYVNFNIIPGSLST